MTTQRILCYGDSNTWGKKPTGLDRYDEDIRWPKKLQQLLGANYEIIEEGLRSRTISLDDPDSQKAGRNGLTLLQPLLESHNPIDVLILMLGTNDCKSIYNQSAEQIAHAWSTYVPIIETFAKNRAGEKPHVLLLSPPIVLEAHMQKEYWTGAQQKSEQLGKLFQERAKQFGWNFLDLAQIVQPSSEDGVHLTAEAHAQIAEKISQTIQTSLS
jgi:lysophospholipase L1-like esterase